MLMATGNILERKGKTTNCEKEKTKSKMRTCRASAEISAEEMRNVAALVSYGIDRHMKDERVVNEFGATPEILVVLWKLLSVHLTEKSRPHHMLWWLYHCKHYLTKSELEKAIRKSAPTVRKAVAPIKVAFFLIRNKVVRNADNNCNSSSHPTSTTPNVLLAPVVSFKDSIPEPAKTRQGTNM